MPFIKTKILEELNLSQSLVKDTLCEPHQQPAIFFSDQEKKWKCLQCLMKEQNLHYVSDNFQKYLEEFDQIKANTAEIIKNNSKKMDIMKNWKKDIRSTIVKVRNEFVDWIDTFTNSTIRSLKSIENQ